MIKGLGCYLLSALISIGCVQSEEKRVSGVELGDQVLTWAAPAGGPIVAKIRIQKRYLIDFRLPFENALQSDYGRQERSSGQLSSISLVFLWPSLEGRTPQNGSVFDELGHGRRIRVLVSSFYPVEIESNQIARLAKLHATSLQSLPESIAFVEVGKRYGLNVLDLSSDDEVQLPQIRSQQKQLGWPPVRRNQLYTSVDQKEVITTFITCDHPTVKKTDTDRSLNGDGVASPSCRHFFYFEPLKATILATYSRDYLQEWKEIQVELRALLNTFIVH